MGSRTNRTYAEGERLLKKLELGYSVAAACKAEGIARSTYYVWLEKKEEFAAAAHDAIEAGTDRIEDVALRKAIEGDNAMIALMLKSRRKDKYGEKQTLEHTGAISFVDLHRIAESKAGEDDSRSG